MVAIPIIVVLLIPYVGLSGFKQTNDIVSQMPADKQSVQGFNLMQEHFPAGQLTPVYLLIEASPVTSTSSVTTTGSATAGGSITDTDSLNAIKTIAQSLQNVAGSRGWTISRHRPGS